MTNRWVFQQPDGEGAACCATTKSHVAKQGRSELRQYKCSGSVFGPAEGDEGVVETREGQADNVEVAAFDARDVAAGAALDGVAAGFVVGLAGSEITGDFFRREHGEMDQRGLDEGEALGVGKADEGDSGDDGVRKTGKFFEHVASVIGGAGLAEDVAFEGDFGVGADDDGGANGAGSDELGFGDGETLDESVDGFARVGSFVDGGREDGEGEASVAQDFGAADGSGSEDELHGDSRGIQERKNTTEVVRGQPVL